MEIKITNMQLRNFKGVRNLNLDFGQITSITGDNATGKTTLFDAFTWLLFGKNSEDAKDFNIKTLGADGHPMHRLEHQVEATLDVDGRKMKFSRTFKEKWTKKRGSENEEFTGHETEFFIDDVPLSQKEYQSRVDFLLREDVFKMVTNPLFFNSLKWQDRRAVLEMMAGKIDINSLASGNQSFVNLLKELGNETLVDFKKKIAAKKSKIKDVLEHIPARIDELDRSRPEPVDYEILTAQKSRISEEIKSIEGIIEDAAKAHQEQLNTIKQKQNEKHQLEMKLLQLKQDAGANKRNKLSEISGQISSLQSEVQQHVNVIEREEKSIESSQQLIKQLSDRNAKLRTDWVAKNAKTLTIDEHSLSCPTCKQLLPEEQRNNTSEQLTANFNASKASALKQIDSEGLKNKQAIDEHEKSIKKSQGNVDSNRLLIAQKQQTIELLNKDLEIVKGWPDSFGPEVESAQKELDAFVIPQITESDQSAAQKEQKRQLQIQLESINASLAGKEQADKIDERKSQLQAEEKKLSQELADLEKTEFTIAAFSKAKIEAIEAAINGKFKLVRFKMFEQQINGGETEACECLVNGVPYSDVNTAGKIAAGIDIINALTAHYKVSAPIWIDNRESVVKLPECTSQIINLSVVPGAKLSFAIETPFYQSAGASI